MKKKNTSTYFWTSYADLMTSLFFVMIVFFAVAIGLLQHKREEAENAKRVAEDAKVVAENEIKKIQEIENAIKSIDPHFFEYNEEYKKHILKIDVQFPTGEFNINKIPVDKRDALRKAGGIIARFMSQEHQNNPEVQYLLIIEGQASRDNYWQSAYENNDVLSFQRALELKKYWENTGISFGEECEVIVCGSGQDGAMRLQPDTPSNKANQRFLIHIMPKPGVIDNK